MIIKKIEYRGLKITSNMNKGVFINGVLYIPNGTGPSQIFGSKTLGKVSLFILKKVPSDIFQRPASFMHDIMCKIGGKEKDFKRANKLMRKVAISHVHDYFAVYNPLRYVADVMMWRNYYAVSGSIGREAFNFNDNPPPILHTLEEYRSLRPE